MSVPDNTEEAAALTRPPWSPAARKIQVVSHASLGAGKFHWVLEMLLTGCSASQHLQRPSTARARSARIWGNDGEEGMQLCYLLTPGVPSGAVAMERPPRTAHCAHTTHSSGLSAPFRPCSYALEGGRRSPACVTEYMDLVQEVSVRLSAVRLAIKAQRCFQRWLVNWSKVTPPRRYILLISGAFHDRRSVVNSPLGDLWVWQPRLQSR